MKRLALIVNFTKLGAAELAREVCARLSCAGLEPLVSAADNAVLAADVTELTENECLSRCDALIAIGGDGTILAAARKVLPYEKPVLGINAGRLGFLAGLERHELSLLPGLASGEFSIDSRMLLEVRVWQDDTLLSEGRCINDAVIARQSVSRVMELEVECGGGRMLNYLGDGVIFSTPTGSTAYSFSAGGPVVEPNIESIILTPVCNHLLFSRAIVFSADTPFSVDIQRDGLALACDSEPPLTLLAGQRVAVRRAEAQAQFIRLKSESFLDILNDKMRIQ